MQTFTLPKGVRNLSRIVAFMSALSPAFEWDVTIKRVQKKRSNEQNSYLWGVVYPAIIEHVPEWTDEDIHELMLAECFGSKVIEAFGKKKRIPLKRTRKLSTVEFMDYVAFIQQYMSQYGVYIPDPNEEIARAA